MEIHLKHPVHGEKIAIAEAEAKQDEGRGWSRVSPSPNPIAVQLATVRCEETTIQPLKKRGRPRKAA